MVPGRFSAKATKSFWKALGQLRISERPARYLVSPNTQGQNHRGTWNAATADFNGKTFEDMLKRTAEKQIGGSWQSGRTQGNWWLQR
jgi:hypothetical protein